MENPRLRLLRIGRSRPPKCRCSRNRHSMCKGHYRPTIRYNRHAWRQWERAARTTRQWDDPPVWRNLEP